jgi:hypothetical protein
MKKLPLQVQKYLETSVVNCRVYYQEDYFDCYTIVWPYKGGYSALSESGQICQHFEDTKNNTKYSNPLDSKGHNLGKRVKWENLDFKIRNSLRFLFQQIWDLDNPHTLR